MVDNKRLCFCFMVYRDWELAERLIDQLVTVFPTANIICIADGTTNQKFAEFCTRHQTMYFESWRLIAQRFGGAWSKRALETYIKHSGADYLIRLDTDSYVLRDFKYLPEGDIAGNILKTSRGKQYIQGGCILLKRSTVIQILESNLLDDDKYKTDTCFGYQRYDSHYAVTGEETNSEWLKAEDHILSDVAEQLGLTMNMWHDVYTRFRQKCLNPTAYAIVHPVKELLPYWR